MSEVFDELNPAFNGFSGDSAKLKISTPMSLFT